MSDEEIMQYFDKFMYHIIEAWREFDPEFVAYVEENGGIDV